MGPYRLFSTSYSDAYADVLAKHVLINEETYSVSLDGEVVQLRDSNGQNINEAVLKDIESAAAKESASKNTAVEPDLAPKERAPLKNDVAAEDSASKNAAVGPDPLPQASAPLKNNVIAKDTASKDVPPVLVEKAAEPPSNDEKAVVVPKPSGATTPDAQPTPTVPPTAPAPTQVESKPPTGAATSSPSGFLLESPEVDQLASTPLTSMSLGTATDVTILYCDTPDAIFFDAVANKDVSEPFLDSIAELYAESATFPRLINPSVGDLCVVVWAEDNAPYRAQVLQLLDDGQKAQVLFIDYGNEALDVPVGELIALDERLKRVPALAMGPFSLLSTPVTPEMALHFFDHFHQDETSVYSATILNENGLVKLVDGKGVDVGEALRKLQSGGSKGEETESPVGSTPLTTHGVTPNPTPEGTPMTVSPSQAPNAVLLASKMEAASNQDKGARSASTSIPATTTSAPVEPDAASVSTTIAASSTNPPSDRSDTVANPVAPTAAVSSFPPLPESLNKANAPTIPLGKAMPFCLSESVSPGEFYVSFDEYEVMGEELMEYLQSAKDFPMVTNLNVGDFCVGIFSEDESW